MGRKEYSRLSKKNDREKLSAPGPTQLITGVNHINRSICMEWRRWWRHLSSDGGVGARRRARARYSRLVARIFELVFTSNSETLSLLRSGSLFGSPAPSPSSGPRTADRISDLPDDLLLLVLARLGCVRTAARASVISRRWRGLWTRLPALVFRDVPFPSVEAVLARVVSSGSASTVSRLDI